MNNKFLLYSSSTLIVTLLLLLPACDWFKTKKEATESTRALKTGLIIVDVNDQELYNDAHIKNALHIPYDKVISDTEFLTHFTSNWDKNSSIAVYCTNYQCTASDDIAKKLKNMGFGNVRVYKGGIQQWYQLAQQDKNAYPIEGPGLLGYLKKPLQKVEHTDSEIPEITAEQLSKEQQK